MYFFSASDTVHGIYDSSSNRTKVVGSALHVSHIEQRAALHLHLIYLFLSGHHLAARGHICFWSENLSCRSLCLVGCRKHPREIQWQWFPHDWEDTDCILLSLETHQPEWIGAIFSCDFTGWYLLTDPGCIFESWRQLETSWRSQEMHLLALRCLILVLPGKAVYIQGMSSAKLCLGAVQSAPGLCL